MSDLLEKFDDQHHVERESVPKISPICLHFIRNGSRTDPIGRDNLNSKASFDFVVWGMMLELALYLRMITATTSIRSGRVPKSTR